MGRDEGLRRLISEVSAGMPDPERTERNMLRLFEAAPEGEAFLPYLWEIGRLFSVSQFLSNYCIARPDELLAALGELGKPVGRELLLERAGSELSLPEEADAGERMRVLRGFKRRYLLRITLRDLTGRTGVTASMEELSHLAEVIVTTALRWSLELNRLRFGEPEERAITLISLGKLGCAELNYSSDIDLIAVYDREGGETSGVLKSSGVRMNRISNHEFYCRVVELFSRLLSHQTGEGIVYRVDLRLRPQGQKGELALPLKAYQTYYESWGRTWERMVLIRARPVAGDARLGRAFLEMIVPFVWKRSIDYTEIEEIRGMKKKIDSTLARDDIKRGYGGIREIEFFVQTFQLIYGGENPELRSRRLSEAMEVLKGMGLVPGEEIEVLRANYLHLRRIEHYLQMKDDLQTHLLPRSGREMEVLSRLMGFASGEEFLTDLRLRRMQVKKMYNSLLGTEEEIHAEALTLLEGDLTDEELKGYLSFRGAKRPERCIVHLKKVREQIGSFKSRKDRAVLRGVLPVLLERVLVSESPDRALSGLESLLALMGENETSLTALTTHKGLMDAIVTIFSLSPYLTRLFLSSSRYLGVLVEGMTIRKTLRRMEEELRRIIEFGGRFPDPLGEYKSIEEIRLGMFFLTGVITTGDLLRYLSHLAEAVIRTVLDRADGGAGLSVIAMGKLGGREITFGSDLDVIFLTEGHEGVKTAETVIKTLTTYTGRGMLYDVDVRLRPDGTKGVLVKDIEGYRNYYLRNAHPWELQALLRARPVAGDEGLVRGFMAMAAEVISLRGAEVDPGEVRAMRQKILRELSQEQEGVDIKLGPGGIEEIEFHVQLLQLRNARRLREVLVQNTSAALKRLAKGGLITPAERETLAGAYQYLRRLETFLRLNEEQVVVGDSETAELAATFMGHGGREEFLDHLQGLRGSVLAVVG